ncbi:MAG: MOSC domain-containing protein [Nostocoides sp.]
MTGIRVTGLNLHPVKSTAIRPVAAAEVTYAGLLGDRRWMVVDADHAMLSAREDSGLFTIVADIPQTEPTLLSGLVLSQSPSAATGLAPLHVDEPDRPAVDVTLHGKPLRAVPADADATAWVRDALGRHDVTLFWCDDPTRRPLNPEYSRPGDHTALADGYPVTLASTESLRRLNEWIAETAAERGDPVRDPLPITRFRPNVLVDGDLEPFAEDGWSGVTIGDVAFRLPKGVDRCVMTTIDPASLATGHEPIRTLARHRKGGGKTWFAVHLIPDVEGPIRVGDPVLPDVRPAGR